MQSARLEYLLQQQLDAALTPAEQQELDLFLIDEENREAFTTTAVQMLERQMPEAGASAAWQQIPDRILAMDKPTIVRRLPYVRWIAAAAIVFALLLAGGIFWRARHTPQLAQQTIPHIAPGTDKATLVLADGAVVKLDSTGRQLIQKGIRQQGGLLQYEGAAQQSATQQAAAIAYNTLATPRGGQFQVQLPDGTRAWLNAASSLRYPTAFKGRERIVDVTGEVYFEVAANAAQPFIVQANGLKVTVLGTHFNVNTYKDDGTLYVTLLEGAVRVQGETENSLTLQPGRQAALRPGSSIQVTDADVEEVIAWKNGFFVFTNASLEQVFNQLSRWYNLDIQLDEAVRSKRFVGKMPRAYALEEILAVLAESGVHIKIEGNKMHIQP